MNVPENILFTKDHEWVEINGEIATIGISDYAQGELGDIVFIDSGWCDEYLMGIITGFIYENEAAEMAQIYYPAINFKDYVPVEHVKVVA